ncbi:hypothetical protein [Sanguibacter suaedae]|uniref:Uncharacterized protein n=1 Tax=Sanguibacter suaedae TaxID=2795737 RepID=A0A934I9L2_9MICO|nr:hypothetical protein [Sanguibacter suaedae]MBI9113745.1 hypothetical protein [Sanguibacter suaedae]
MSRTHTGATTPVAELEPCARPAAVDYRLTESGAGLTLRDGGARYRCAMASRQPGSCG